MPARRTEMGIKFYAFVDYSPSPRLSTGAIRDATRRVWKVTRSGMSLSGELPHPVKRAASS